MTRYHRPGRSLTLVPPPVIPLPPAPVRTVVRTVVVMAHPGSCPVCDGERLCEWDRGFATRPDDEEVLAVLPDPGPGPCPLCGLRLPALLQPTTPRGDTP